MQKTYRSIQFAFYLGIASTLFVVEQFIPKPFPFLRLGLANIIVLILLQKKMYKETLGIAIGKSIIGSFFSGVLFSPTAILSLVSSAISALTMVLLKRFQTKLSLYGISVSGAVIHNLVQLCLVRLLILKENQIFQLTPYLVFLSLLTGLTTAFLAEKFVQRKALSED